MLTYDLSCRQGMCIYEYLYRNIREDIRSGRILPGERLPSKRALAEHLGISVITVKNAYEQLLDEGYITSVEKRGYFASDLGQNERPERIVGKNGAMRKTDTDEEQSVEMTELSANTPPPSLFPFSVWSSLVRRVLSDEDEKLLRRVPSAGVFELRSAIADHLYRIRGMEVSPSDIIIGAGSEYLFNMLVQLLGRDKVYATENPGYKKFSEVCTSCGAKVVQVRIDGRGMSAESLKRSGADIVHISPNHHYPTGNVMPVQRRREILEYVEGAEGRYIIEDDFDSEYRLSGRPLSSLFSEDAEGRVIYLNTFSQTISPSIRIGYMVLPRRLYRLFEEKMNFYSCPVSSFEQYTLAAFIKEGYFEKHINRMKRYYRRRRDEVIDKVGGMAKRCGFELVEGNAGMHFQLRLKNGESEEEIRRRCRQHNIKVAFVSDYASDSARGYERMAIVNYSGLDTEQIVRCVEVLCGVNVNKE